MSLEHWLAKQRRAQGGLGSRLLTNARIRDAVTRALDGELDRIEHSMGVEAQRIQGGGIPPGGDVVEDFRDRALADTLDPDGVEQGMSRRARFGVSRDMEALRRADAESFPPEAFDPRYLRPSPRDVARRIGSRRAITIHQDCGPICTARDTRC